jgi:hypothetical protein
MPILRDSQGQLYAVPSKEAETYKVTAEEAEKLTRPKSGRDSDDVELQGPSQTSPWYSGD